jgi:hypothetical protein
VHRDAGPGRRLREQQLRVLTVPFRQLHPRADAWRGTCTCTSPGPDDSPAKGCLDASVDLCPSRRYARVLSVALAGRVVSTVSRMRSAAAMRRRMPARSDRTPRMALLAARHALGAARAVVREAAARPVPGSHPNIRPSAIEQSANAHNANRIEGKTSLPARISTEASQHTSQVSKICKSCHSVRSGGSQCSSMRTMARSDTGRSRSALRRCAFAALVSK